MGEPRNTYEKSIKSQEHRYNSMMGPPGRSKRVPRGFKMAPRGLRTAPRGPQEGAKRVPRGFQEGSRWLQEAYKRLSRSFLKASTSKMRVGTHFGAFKVPKWCTGISKIIEILGTVAEYQGFGQKSRFRNFQLELLRDPISGFPGLRFGTMLALKMPPRAILCP